MKVIKRNAVVRDVFIGEDVFDLRLAIGELQDLEDLLDIGVTGLLNRFLSQTWRTRELREVIRTGLVGAGVEPQKAHRIMSSNVVCGNLAAYYDPAVELLRAALIGEPEDATGEAQAAPAAPPSTPQPEPTGQPTTEPLERRVGRPRKSENSRSGSSKKPSAAS